ncbi:MAG: tetratricopeptide repeat protein [Afipia sp.]|nr:tetratricopeptide repeat protein [Afipia sp.]
MTKTSRSLAAGLALIASLGLAPNLLSVRAYAVDNMASADAPDLSGPRAKIKAKNYVGAIEDLKKIADTNQHADVYNLLGYSLRKNGDFKTALTYYTKALEFDPNHRAAREYLGELYVETGNLDKAKEQLTALAKLCPSGCEEREDLQKAIGGRTSSN